MNNLLIYVGILGWVFLVFGVVFYFGAVKREKQRLAEWCLSMSRTCDELSHVLRDKESEANRRRSDFWFGASYAFGYCSQDLERQVENISVSDAEWKELTKEFMKYKNERMGLEV